MRREPSDDIVSAARSRLEELARHWVAPEGPAEVEDLDPDQDELPDRLIGPVTVGELPEPGRHARSGFGGVPRLRRPHLGLIALVGTAAVACAAWFAFSGAPTPVPVASTTHPTTSPSLGRPAPAAATTGVPAAVTSSGPVVVDVAGKVRHPGVATLPGGSRVIDALRRAGGARRGVDLSSLNLARVLVDGEQILVGVRPAGGVAAGAVAGSAGPSGGSGSGTLVNLNTATLDALEGLPGVGPVTAQKILDWRTAHGSFSAVDELMEVPGIGPKTLAEIAPGVTL